MWYFAWILGLPLAVTFAVLNAMWFELMEDKYTALTGDNGAADPSEQKRRATRG